MPVDNLKSRAVLKISARICLTVLLFLFASGFAIADQQILCGKYHRIISMGPSVTETIFALGCGENVVGVSSFCVYPPQALKKARVGGILNPNLERYEVLNPDLVIFRGTQQKVLSFCQSRDIATLDVPMDSLAEIYSSIEKIGQTLGCEKAAFQMALSISLELESIKKSVQGLDRPKVFVCLGRTPGGLSSVFTCGGASFVSQLLEIAGGDNIFSNVTLAYPEASKESLIRRAPEIILEMHPGENISDLQKKRLIAQWDILRTIPAVKNKRVHIMTQNFLLVPGPRVGAAARAIALVLYGNDVLLASDK